MFQRFMGGQIKLSRQKSPILFRINSFPLLPEFKKRKIGPLESSNFKIIAIIIRTGNSSIRPQKKRQIHPLSA